MARKRCRVRSKAKAEANTKTPTVKIKPEKESDAGDSGNDSPSIREGEHQEWKDGKLSHHCAESIRAWKCYQAFALERYHWFLDKRKNSIAEDYASRIKEACLNVHPNDLASKVLALQKELADDLVEIDSEERLANKQFCENIKALEDGRPMDELPLVDPYITLDQVSDFISKYSDVDLDLVEDDKKTINVSFSGSISSQDSGMHVTSDKMASSTLVSDDIWKPDSDLFAGSFTVDGFYQPPCEKETKLIQPTSWCATEMSYDQQVTTDVLCTPFPQMASVCASSEAAFASADPEAISALAPPKDSSSPSPMPRVPPPPETDPHAAPPSIADEDAAIKAVVYTQKLSSPTQMTTLSCGPAANWADSLSHLSTEFGVAPLCQPTEKVGVETTPTQLPELQGKALEFSAKSVHFENSIQQEVGPEKAKSSTCGVNEKLKRKPMKEPVKFSGRKSVSVKDEQSVKDILFKWSSEETVDAAEDKDDSDQTAPQKPKPSFAAVAKHPAKVPPKPATPSKPGLPSTDRGDGVLVFSTKKPARKYPKASCLNKTSLCWAYQQNKNCAWGSECIYAHGKAELESVPRWFKKGNLVVGSKTSSQPAQPPHPEPCTNHYCHWRRHFLLRKTTICKSWQNQRCANSAESCHFAHGTADLLPLPKKEMCRMFANGKCKLKSEQCVYAHDKSELRKSKSKKKKKPSKQTSVVDETSKGNSRLRTISEASTASNETWPLAVRRGRVRTVSGTSCLSNSSYQSMKDLEEFDWPAWNSQPDVPSDEELDFTWNEDECVICSHGFSEEEPKCVLECEHDTFHQKCMAQWIQRDPTCPVCRFPIETDSLDVDEAWYLE